MPQEKGNYLQRNRFYKFTTRVLLIRQKVIEKDLDAMLSEKNAKGEIQDKSTRGLVPSVFNHPNHHMGRSRGIRTLEQKQ